jgi:hypothetical protein
MKLIISTKESDITFICESFKIENGFVHMIKAERENIKHDEMFIAVANVLFITVN